MYRGKGTENGLILELGKIINGTFLYGLEKEVI